jgi:hypothetical protein
MTFLTIREAANRTGHSTHKIRRLIKAIAYDPKHADRSHIEPSSADVERLNAEGVQFTWRISEELVLRQLGDAASATTTDNTGKRAGESADSSSLLERVIAAQEKTTAQLVEQLKVKDEQIAALNDRLRESNYLLGSLQQQLPEPKKSSVGVLGVAKPTAGKRPEKGSVPIPKQKRRGWLGKIFS